MFLTSDERRGDRPNRPSCGLRVTFPNDVTHWFPGEESVAVYLAERACPEELFRHPGTSLEYGEKFGPSFVLKKHLRGPKIAVPERDGAAVIWPDALHESDPQ